MFKQLNGPVLKSLKRSKLKSEKILVRPGQNFVFCFGPGQAETSISPSVKKFNDFLLVKFLNEKSDGPRRWLGPSLKNPAHADPFI